MCEYCDSDCEYEEVYEEPEYREHWNVEDVLAKIPETLREVESIAEAKPMHGDLQTDQKHHDKGNNLDDALSEEEEEEEEGREIDAIVSDLITEAKNPEEEALHPFELIPYPSTIKTPSIPFAWRETQVCSIFYSPISFDFCVPNDMFACLSVYDQKIQPIIMKLHGVEKLTSEGEWYEALVCFSIKNDTMQVSEYKTEVTLPMSFYNSLSHNSISLNLEFIHIRTLFLLLFDKNHMLASLYLVLCIKRSVMVSDMFSNHFFEILQQINMNIGNFGSLNPKEPPWKELECLDISQRNHKGIRSPRLAFHHFSKLILRGNVGERSNAEEQTELHNSSFLDNTRAVEAFDSTIILKGKTNT
ncbi:PREDICTED: uncharacterized protein LOC104815178 isoform X1 [Tarenaya hassleriana]|uniref:uncharacterized protein LOC104815178 isoform X1 n=1 Tax=Tarenaya hassleriana TaxID=28532 RepID=UPI0008FD1047|nr:PREDICTED: uncharacterized protein LOC104815178 isoform X1 [Tarenaya hassleriana]